MKGMVSLKKYVLGMTALLLTTIVTGCSNDTQESKENQEKVESKQVPENSEVSEETVEKAYGIILRDYTEKLRSATPKLIEEYNRAAEDNEVGLQGLANLSNNKVQKLAEINNEGIEKMASVMFDKGTGSYNEYGAWADKLTSIYLEEAGKITNSYLDSAK